MIRNAAAIVRARLRQTQGLAAVISRGEQSCNATVTMGRVDMAATAQKEFRVQSGMQDIFIDAASYKPTGTASLPVDGDRLAVTLIDSTVALFDVRAPSNGMQCFQRSDGNQAELRIHTKKVSS